MCWPPGGTLAAPWTPGGATASPLTLGAPWPSAGSWLVGNCVDKLWPVGGALGRVVGAVGKVLGWPEEEPAAAFCEAGSSPGLE